MLWRAGIAKRWQTRGVVGIDLGTTNSCVAVFANGQSTVIPNGEGYRTTPSVVAFDENHKSCVGVSAKRQAVTNHVNTLFATKRLMGRKFSEVGKEAGMFPFKVVEAANGDAWVEVNGRRMSPSEVGGLILSTMREAASAYLGSDVKEAVITVPAYFDEGQRQATKDAGKIAGLQVLRIINEPTAAALAYGCDGKRIVVYDLGGGTFDVSILELNGGVFEVKATNGNSALGGEDVDNAIVAWMIANLRKKTGLDVSKDKLALQRLKEAAETAKQELSSKDETEVNLPFIAADPKGAPVHLRDRISREHLEAIATPILAQTIEPCRRCLKDSGLRKEDIDEVILVGGMTRMPKVQEIVASIFGKPATHKGVNPDEAVAVGAAIQAAVLKGEKKDLLLLDVTPLSLGIETMGGVFTSLIPRNTTIPTKKASLFSTAVDNQERVSINIYQGERALAKDNKLLGNFELTGIPPAPRGVPQIEVSFNIDADGLLSVTAKDRATGQSQNITVKSSGGLSPEEVDQLIKEAEDNKQQDNQQKQFISAKNDANQLAATAQALLDSKAISLTTPQRNIISDAIQSATTASSLPELRTAMSLLKDAIQDINSKSR